MLISSEGALQDDVDACPSKPYGHCPTIAPYRVETFAALKNLGAALNDNRRRPSKAFEAELRKLIPYLTRFAASLCTNNSVDQDEVVQRALISACENYDQFDTTRGTMQQWLTTIVFRKFIDDYKKHGRRDASHESIDDPNNSQDVAALSTSYADSPEGHMVYSDFYKSILPSMSQRLRDAALLAAAEVSMQEIALIFDIPLGTAKSRAQRGQQYIEECLNTGIIPQKANRPNHRANITPKIEL